MKKRVFSLVELVVAIVVMGIITSTAVIGYKTVMENAAAKVCATNQKVIYETLQIYALEKNALPGSLGGIPSEYYEKAYAKVLEREKVPLLIELAYFLIDLRRDGTIKKVFAAGGLSDLLAMGLKKEVLVCPKDASPSHRAGVDISYGINAALSNVSSTVFTGFTGIVIGDCDNPTFDDSSDLRKEHGVIIKKAIGIKKGAGSIDGTVDAY